MEKGKPATPKKQRQGFLAFYENNYKKLLIFSLLIVVLSLGVIGFKLAITGDFIDKGVSLKGGVTVTVLTDQPVDLNELKTFLLESLPESDISIKTTSEFGVQKSVIVDASDVTAEALIKALQQKIPAANAKDNIGIDSTDPVLGALAFIQTMKAIFIAFLFMAIVVFLYFGEKTSTKVLAAALTLIAGILMLSTNGLVFSLIALLIAAFLIYLYAKHSIPSVAVILAAFSDMVFVVAILNLLGIKLTLAGIAAFLMLIGYSVDTDILMSVRVLKRKEGSVFSRVVGAMKTGLTMTSATLIVVIVALLVSQSDIIIQIMTVLFIGLLADIVFTWIQNAGILRWYLEAKGKK